MRIIPYEAAHAAPLHRIYRHRTDDLPHCCFAPSADYFTAALGSPSLARTTLFVAEDAAGVRGFAALLDMPARRAETSAPAPAPQEAPAAQGNQTKAEITACFASDEGAEQVLVEACVARTQSLGAAEFVAFPREHGHAPVRAYNADWCGLSDRLGTTARVLARKGFAPSYRELHLTLDGDRFPPKVVSPPRGVDIVAGAPQGVQQEVSLRALCDGEQVGVCVSSTLAHVTDDPAARNWGYIHWLHVAESWRRRGLARYLITRALSTLAAQGSVGCWLSTGADNWPAQPLYLSLGFEIVDTSACLHAPQVE